jgi:hypothetical protein
MCLVCYISFKLEYRSRCCDSQSVNDLRSILGRNSNLSFYYHVQACSEAQLFLQFLRKLQLYLGPTYTHKIAVNNLERYLLCSYYYIVLVETG